VMILIFCEKLFICIIFLFVIVVRADRFDFLFVLAIFEAILNGFCIIQ
jgi:hypothetical protein